MPTKPIKLNAYNVTESTPGGLQNALSEFSSPKFESAKERTCTIMGKKYQLELQPYIPDFIWIVRVIRFRFDGPGRGVPEGEVSPMGLSESEQFVHDTLFLYSSERNVLLGECNRPGTRFNRFIECLENVIGYPLTVNVLPRLSQHASARAARFDTLSRVKVKTGWGKLDSGTMINVKVDQNLIRHLGQDDISVELTLKVPKRSHHLRNNILGRFAIQRLQDWADDELDSDSDSIEVEGRRLDDPKWEVLDLLGQQVTTIGRLDVDPDTRQILLRTRIRHLLSFLQNIE